MTINQVPVLMILSKTETCTPPVYFRQNLFLPSRAVAIAKAKKPYANRDLFPSFLDENFGLTIWSAAGILF